MSDIISFYLTRQQFRSVESGSVVKYDGDYLTHLERPRSIKINNDIPKDWINILYPEAFYLGGKCFELREHLYNNRFFDKICNLKTNDECYYIDRNIRHQCTISHRTEIKGDLHFVININGVTKVVPSYDITLEGEVELGVMKREIEYYLLISEYHECVKGTLFVIRDCKIFTYKEERNMLGCIEDIKEKSLKISVDYAELLDKISINDRGFKVLQEMQPDLQYARDDRFDLLRVTHSFKVEEIVNFTMDDYSKLEVLKNEEKIDYFENDKYISWTSTVLENLQTKIKENDSLSLSFTLLSLQIMCKIIRNNRIFIRKVKDNDDLMNKLSSLFDYMANKENLTIEESKILSTILSMYWCILGVEKPLDSSMLKNLKVTFDNVQTTDENKFGAALCLTYLIEAQSKLVNHLMMFFFECSKHEILEQFSYEEFLTGLGKVSLLYWEKNITDYDKINKKYIQEFRKSIESIEQESKINDNAENSINVLTNSFTCGQSPNITEETHHHLKFLYEYHSKIELKDMDKFIDVTQHFVKIILNNLGKEGELKNKVVRDCAMTALSLLCDLLDSDKCFSKMVADNNSLMYLLKGLFETLANGDKPTSMEVQFLENVIFIYWNILKSITDIKFEPSTESMEKCYSSSKFNIQIKIAAAMCLTSLRKHPSPSLKKIKSYLKELRGGDSQTETFGFSKAELTMAIGNLSLISKSSSSKISVSADLTESISQESDEVLIVNDLDNVENSLIVLKDLFKSASGQTINITDDTHNHLKIIYENKEQICGKYTDDFINITTNFVHVLCGNVGMKERSENKVFFDCAMTVLSTVCDLCDSNLSFVSKVVGNNILMNLFKVIFEMMVGKSELSSLEKQFLEIILFIYWNIIKSGNMILFIPSFVIFEKCFNNHNLNIHIRTAAALCLALDPELSHLLKEVKLYLMNLCKNHGKNQSKKYHLRDIHGFPIEEIYMAYGKISLIVELSDDKSTDDVERSLSVITSTFKSVKSPNITADTHNHFKILYVNQLKIVEKYTDEFIDVTQHCVNIILNHIGSKDVWNDKAMRDCSMTDLSIFCDLCDSNEDFVAKVVANNCLMNSIIGLLEKLASESRPSSMQVQFLENTIFIFWNILKFGESMDSLPRTEKIKNCYDNTNMSIQIKTAAALCIAYAYHDSEELLQGVDGYLTKLCIKYKSRKIHEFPRGEIYTALGKVHDVKCKDQDQFKSKFNRLHSNATVPKEDYERCLEFATENMQSVGDGVFECIIKAIRMDNKKILFNFIHNSARPINLQQYPSILSSLIDRNYDICIKSLLKNCETSAKDHPILIELARNPDKEIVSLAVLKIEAQSVNESINKQLLSLAYSRLSTHDTELFKAIIGKCSNQNAFLDENDTFLTKVIRKLKHEHLNDALASAVFDVSVCDGGGISPLCVACTLADEDKIGILVKHYGITQEDKDNASEIIYRNTSLDKTKRSRIIRIINVNAV